MSNQRDSQRLDLSVSRLPTRDPCFEVVWEPSDPENPVNWSIWHRTFIVATVSLATTCVYV